MNQTRALNKRPKTSKGKSYNPTCKISPYVNTGIWVMIFKYLGVSKNLANCRLVCKKWKKYFQKYIQALLIEKRNGLELFRDGWQSRFDNTSPDIKKDIDAALEIKSKYEEYIELLPRKYSLFHRISDLGKLNRPPVVLSYGIMAVMYLFADKEDLKKEGGCLNWTYCKKRLLDKNFMRCMKEITPEKITKEQIAKFQDLVRATMITPRQLAVESTQVCYMMEWALKLVEYKNFVKDLSSEQKEIIGLLNVRQKKQEEIERLQNILSTA